MNTELTLTTKQAIVTGGVATLANILKPLQQEIYLSSVFLAKQAASLPALRPGDKLSLKREPDNRFDDRAIAVLSAQNEKIGYIPENESAVLANLMDAGKLLIAKVESVGNRLFLRVRIGIYLVDY